MSVEIVRPGPVPVAWGPTAREWVGVHRGLTALAGCVLLSLAGCQPPAQQAQQVRVAQPDPEPVNGVGYLVLNAPINESSRDLFITDIDKLRRAGATEIHLGINSPGGDVDAARGMVDYMARLHREGITWKAYNLRLVASAATYVFLNAQDRYTAPNSAFLFHAAGLMSNGPVNAQNLRDEADKLDEYERTIRALLKARTRLNDAETLTYVRRTVVLNPDDARRDGVVDGIATFSVPTGARTWVIAPRVQPGSAQPGGAQPGGVPQAPPPG